MKKKTTIAALLTLLGVGLFVFSVLGFSWVDLAPPEPFPTTPHHAAIAYTYPIEARLAASFGAMLTVAGIVLFRHRNPN